MLHRRRLAVLLAVALCAIARSSCEIGDPPQTEPPEKELEELPTPEKGPAGRKGEFLEQEFFWFNDIDGKQQWEDPSSAQFDDEGNEYYIDQKTKQRTSQRPEEEAWISLYDDDRERNYYLNEVTNATTWEVPYLFAWRKVFVDENNSVVESPEDDDWDDGDWSEGDQPYEGGEEDDGPMSEEELAEMEAMYGAQGGFTDEEAAEVEHAEL